MTPATISSTSTNATGPSTVAQNDGHHLALTTYRVLATRSELAHRAAVFLGFTPRGVVHVDGLIADVATVSVRQ